MEEYVLVIREIRDAQVHYLEFDVTGEIHNLSTIIAGLNGLTLGLIPLSFTLYTRKSWESIKNMFSLEVDNAVA